MATQVGPQPPLQSMQITTNTATATASVTFVNTALTGTITPTKTSRRIKVTVTGSLYNVAAGAFPLATLARDGTNLATDGMTITNDVAAGVIAPAHFTFIDSPATVSSVTYTVQLRVGSGSGQWGYNDGTRSAIQTMVIEEII